MKPHERWSRWLLFAGFLAMLLGAIDPMEGSVLMLAGSGIVALGTYLADATRHRLVVRMWAFGLTVVGVAALWGFSWVGGFGGEDGLSMWWGLLVVPYLVGWSMGVWAKDSPTWVLWIGMLIGGWWAALTGFVMATVMLEEPGSSTPLVVLGGLGLVTIVGCVLRLVQRWR